MSARHDDTLRIQEMHRIICETLDYLRELSITYDSFTCPQNPQEELMADGLIARVLRVTEEAGSLSAAAEPFGIPVKSCRDMRNIIAHTYWRVDKKVIWQALNRDFPALRDACERYARELAIEL